MKNQEIRKFLVEKVNEVIAAPSCCAELKVTAQNYLKALDTPGDAAAAKKLIAELEADVQTIDNVLAFFSSEAGVEYFGAATAASLTEQAKKVKADGGQYCFCPACSAGKVILDHKTLL